ncbi:MAG TPA: sulfatase [Verrucomicrobiae bacterium]
MRTLIRPTRFLTKLILIALSLMTLTLSAAEAKRPNILLIVADDLGYGELSIQGNPQIPTPNIDSLARSGVRFTSGYVSGPYCSPTRAGLLTGRYQQRFGHEFNPGPAQTAATVFGLSLNETTIGNRLKNAGYATGWFGKSHLGYEPQFHPLKRGFDEYFGFLGGAHDYFDAVGDANNPILRGTNRVNAIGYTTEDFANEAVKFIEKHKAGPWFVYLPFNAVHAPLEAPERYLARFSGIDERKRHTFAGMLSAMDDAVGRVLATIRALDQEENTLIFFISDNGGPTAQTTSGNGPLRGFKSQTWEGGIRVPYIIQWKGHLPAGQVDDRPVIQLDVLPTALAAAGVEARPEWRLDGVNLLPYLTGSKAGVPHETLYWRFGGQIAIRKGAWKLVKAPGLSAGTGALGGTANTEGAELYNLREDIGEKNNLAAREPEKVHQLAAAWNAWNAELVEPAWRPGTGAGRKGKAASAAQSSNAASSGPWKSGDVLSPADSPRIANQPLWVTAEIEPEAGTGVIIAQGGAANGYVLFLQDRKLSFGIRSARSLTVVTAKEPLGRGRFAVEARLAEDGRITLTVAGKPVGEGRAPGLIAKQPARGLSVGSDDGAVGDYTPPNAFIGKISKVSLSFR